MTRVTGDELMAALKAADEKLNQDIERFDEDALLLERLNALGAGPELAEGEQAAVAVEPGRQRADGKPWGIGGPRQRRLTEAQVKFAQGLIEEKSLRQAYREAYPNAKGTDGTIAAAAHRLSKHPRIRAMVTQAWAESVEALVDDVEATRRFVVKSLLHTAQTASGEAYRLRALEGLAKVSGAFTPVQQQEVKTVSPEQLRKELQGHLRLIQAARPKTGTDGRHVNQGVADVNGQQSDPTAPAPPRAGD